MVTLQEGQAIGALSGVIAKLDAAISGLQSVISDPDWSLETAVLVNPHSQAFVVKAGEVDRDTLVLMAETPLTAYQAKRDDLAAQLEAL